jgi:hypothetical protein
MLSLNDKSSDLRTFQGSKNLRNPCSLTLIISKSLVFWFGCCFRWSFRRIWLVISLLVSFKVALSRTCCFSCPRPNKLLTDCQTTRFLSLRHFQRVPTLEVRKNALKTEKPQKQKSFFLLKSDRTGLLVRAKIAGLLSRLCYFTIFDSSASNFGNEIELWVIGLIWTVD